ncbi:MAG: hypothetical protein PV340_01530 [Wolbachia sp.]|nr:hypothetical protein [Wolbachia sp.]MDD9335839.1 hypothetical protein [Wolbachia sp.]
MSCKLVKLDLSLQKASEQVTIATPPQTNLITPGASQVGTKEKLAGNLFRSIGCVFCSLGFYIVVLS